MSEGDVSSTGVGLTQQHDDAQGVKREETKDSEPQPDSQQQGTDQVQQLQPHVTSPQITRSSPSVTRQHSMLHTTPSKAMHSLNMFSDDQSQGASSSGTQGSLHNLSDVWASQPYVQQPFAHNIQAPTPTVDPNIFAMMQSMLKSALDEQRQQFEAALQAASTTTGDRMLQTQSQSNQQSLSKLKLARVNEQDKSLSNQLPAKQWVQDMDQRRSASSKDNPRPLAQLVEDISTFRLITPGKAGTHSSMHHPIRQLKSGISGDVTYASNKNSSACPHYFVDVDIDVPVSRGKNQKLGDFGYYELACSVAPEDPDKLKVIQDAEDAIMSTVGKEQENRYAIWESISGSFTLSLRVFESVSIQDGNGKTKKVPGIDITLLNENGEGTSLSTTDDEYRNFVGTARVVFTPSVVTVVKEYRKMVYRCTSILLRTNRSRIKAGVTLSSITQGPKNVDTKEWDVLLQVLKSMIESGTTTPANLIKYLKGNVGQDTNLSKKPALATRQTHGFKVPTRQTVQDDDQEFDDNEDEEQDNYDDDDVLEEEDEEEDPPLKKNTPTPKAVDTNKGKRSNVIEPPDVPQFKQNKPTPKPKHSFKKSG